MQFFKRVLARRLRHACIWSSRRLCLTAHNTSQALPGWKASVTMHRDWAEKSVLVSVPREHRAVEVFQDLEEIAGTIGQAYQFERNLDGNHQDFLLVQFNSREGCDLLRSVSRPSSTSVGFSCTRHLQYIPRSKRKGSNGFPVSRDVILSNLIPYKQRETPPVQFKKENLTDQILAVYHSQKVTELETRSRYFIQLMLKELLGPLFPDLGLDMFGSSVNGLGSYGGDLDIRLTFSPRQTNLNPDSAEARLMFSGSDLLGCDLKTGARGTTDLHILNLAAHLLKFTPGVTVTEKRFHATIPLVVFHHNTFDQQVDISCNTDVSAAKMSMCVYELCRLDARFPHLVSAVKWWYRGCDVPQRYHGSKPNNFLMAMLVVYFLQARAILPPFSRLAEHRDGFKSSFKTKNNETEGELLLDFFRFYSTFDFNKEMISLRSATLLPTNQRRTVCVMHPYAHGNMFRNVDYGTMKAIQKQMALTLSQLAEDGSSYHSVIQQIDSTEDTPMEGHADDIPVEGRIDNIPVEGNIDDILMEGNIDSIPVEASMDNIPVEGSMDKAGADNDSRQSVNGMLNDQKVPMIEDTELQATGGKHRDLKGTGKSAGKQKHLKSKQNVNVSNQQQKQQKPNMTGDVS